MHRTENYIRMIGDTKLKMQPSELQNTHKREYNSDIAKEAFYGSFSSTST